ncbi:type VI secretion system baseplate subunit TssE [Duganella sp. FT109W]|jgi:type VI secretion system protein ImpF|uniref:Type VI secretion system baseplate subunit TssE n=2 Tax=Duganella TaxID=75654 RepID=A0A7X4H5I0_9BURK|nr:MULTISPECIES: type VI secretion system baseplate subunit TssE [Duganella]MYM75716.1 type VI secretion system baseplate subunit TssE [Duganella margarita]MYN41278.1 type VI secretion system baseplate subunit TssE [Duganella margarita]QJD93572.1 type VI secretion system baseplate subunit TssE [Duganella dendranthematis]
MKGFTPGLFDRLMDVPVHGSSSGTVSRLSIEDLKDSVARDLEALLNTRTVIPEELLKRFPECGRSIATYGLNDFAGLSLSSTDDRAFICRSLERAIARHEPRLRNVQASLELRADSVNRLNFAITALLVVNSAHEPVNFDAVLQPSSLHYTISKARRVSPTPLGA